MIEIALSLAIIGFALVAIIGILPIGMNTQKANREETVVNQDASVFMDAIRSGARGLDDLTNHVFAIVITSTPFSGWSEGVPFVTSYTNLAAAGFAAMTYTNIQPYLITNGQRIVGLLTTPKYVWANANNGDFTRNHVVAYVRSLSGPASEKYPQDNLDVQDQAFTYRLTSEVVPNGLYYVEPDWIGTPMDPTLAKSFSANLHEVRLLFRWPLGPEGRLGKGGQSYRALVGGRLVQAVESTYTNYFFDPRTYVKVP